MYVHWKCITGCTSCAQPLSRTERERVWILTGIWKDQSQCRSRYPRQSVKYPFASGLFCYYEKPYTIHAVYDSILYTKESVHIHQILFLTEDGVWERDSIYPWVPNGKFTSLFFLFNTYTPGMYDINALLGQTGPVPYTWKFLYGANLFHVLCPLYKNEKLK